MRSVRVKFIVWSSQLGMLFYLLMFVGDHGSDLFLVESAVLSEGLIHKQGKEA